MTATLRTVAAVLLAAMAWPGADYEELRFWIGGRAGRGEFSGVVLVADGDRTVFHMAAGMAGSRPIALDTRFNIGSINKTFTAVAIAQLERDGRLGFDDPVGKHLKDYPNRDAAATVTIHHLLTHSSGIAPSGPAEPLRFAPGSRQEYSNAGYVVLGRLVEIVSGLSYVDYVTRNVYEPAGMRRTNFDAADGVVAGGSPLGPGNPAGGGFSTAGDLLAFARALQQGKLPQLKVGYGLREQIVNGRRFVGNGGGAPGINAEFRFETSGTLAAVVLSNLSPPSATAVLRQVLETIAVAAVHSIGIRSHVRRNGDSICGSSI